MVSALHGQYIKQSGFEPWLGSYVLFSGQDNLGGGSKRPLLTLTVSLLSQA